MLSEWRQWSPRSTVRVDAKNEHRYRSAPWPERMPPVPIATYLADRHSRYTLLAFDLDAGPYGPEAVAVDANVLTGVLTDLGVSHLQVQSGPSGGRHIWVRVIDPGIPAEKVADLARRLRAHLPTLDISPLTNPVSGAVRIPGSVHRSGGNASPLLTGRELGNAVRDMQARPAPPDLAEWLTARFPTTARQNSTQRTTTIGLRLVGQGPATRVDRARTELSTTTAERLATRLTAADDRSAHAWSIMLGMAASGWCWTDVLQHLHKPGLVRLREDLHQNEAHALTQWHKALRTAAETAWPRAQGDHTVDDPVRTHIEAVFAAANSDPATWARKGWASAERVLHSLLVVCAQAHTTTVNIDVRRLAEAANVHAATASRALHRLQAEGWIRRVAEAQGTESATWELAHVAHDTAATQGETRPLFASSTLRLHHAHHDIWVWREGLGGIAERIHAAWQGGHVSVLGLVSATGYSSRCVRAWLRYFRELNLLTPSRNRWDEVAVAFGSYGAMVRRAQSHLVDRLVRDWWDEELRWRKQRGKRRYRGPGRATTDPQAIALPIAAPSRTRYGRFPTRPSGKVDYPSARSLVRSHMQTSNAA